MTWDALSIIVAILLVLALLAFASALWRHK